MPAVQQTKLSARALGDDPGKYLAMSVYGNPLARRSTASAPSAAGGAPRNETPPKASHGWPGEDIAAKKGLCAPADYLPETGAFGAGAATPPRRILAATAYSQGRPPPPQSRQQNEPATQAGLGVSMANS